MKRLLIILAFLSSDVIARPCCEPWGWTGYAAFVSAGAVEVAAVTAAATTTATSLYLVQKSWADGFNSVNQSKMQDTEQRQLLEQGRLTVQASREADLRIAEAQTQYADTPMQDQTITNALVMSGSAKVAQTNVTKLAKSWSDSFIAKDAMEGSYHSIVRSHEGYCDAAAVAAGCAKLAPAALQNADLDVRTILLPGDGQNPTLSDEERDAAVIFIKNVTNPIAATTPPFGTTDHAMDALLMSDEAALSAAALSLQSILAHRTRRHAFE